MDKFEVTCSWQELHSGELIIEAEDKEEAIEVLKSEQARLLELIVEKYDNDTFSKLSDISVKPDNSEVTEENDILIKNGEIKINL
ncbi:MAG: hypothetical protein R6V17_05845 [Halanaerobacter sp.]